MFEWTVRDLCHGLLLEAQQRAIGEIIKFATLIGVDGFDLYPDVFVYIPSRHCYFGSLLVCVC